MDAASPRFGGPIADLDPGIAFRVLAQPVNGYVVVQTRTADGHDRTTIDQPPAVIAVYPNADAYAVAVSEAARLNGIRRPGSREWHRPVAVYGDRFFV